MKLLGNILWLLLGGLLMGLLYILFGALYCITVIFFPFGFQLIKIGVYAMCPFGTEPQFKKEPMGCFTLAFNILWILLGGIELSLLHLVIGALCYLTLIGIPFGRQHFKLARLALLPFGQN